MELKKIRDFVYKIEAEARNHQQKVTARTCNGLLEMLNMLNRRNFSTLRRFDRQFRQVGISYWRKNEAVKRLEFFKKGETITFLLTEIVHEEPAAVPQAEPAARTPLPSEFRNSGTVAISPAPSGICLYPHQEQAIARLDEAVKTPDSEPFAGLLVLPTGGGKTLTAAYWIAKNLLDKGRKVLWIAHRHELLEQALRTFVRKLAFNDIFVERTYFTYRLISGSHAKCRSIRSSDDIIICSKDSISAGFEQLLISWIRYSGEEIFIVIDEAHHATAKTYRSLIERIREHAPRLQILGLTATPFRTSANEKGLLKKVFPNDIIFKQDLRSLIRLGILSEPHFEEVATGRKMIEEFELSEAQVQDLNSRFGDFNAILGERISRSIATNKKRNNAIVNRYLQQREKYRQTIVFALNVDNAIALNALFRQAGIRSDFVVSTLRDGESGASRSAKGNKLRIEQFRAGELEVLINVNILTEGTDLPNVQSVFLARPTISSILMTQMIGRGLRGPRAGGTKEAYIVSFADDWQHKVAWVNPEKLFIEENADFSDANPESGTQLLRLVAMAKMEEFAIMNNEIVEAEQREELEKLQFISRVPLGIYQFRFLTGCGDPEQERCCEILVYDNVHSAYEALLRGLPGLFAEHDLQQQTSIDEEQLGQLAGIAEERYFSDAQKYPAYHPEDIRDLLRYFAVQGDVPLFIPLKDRWKYDIDKIAGQVISRRLDDLDQVSLINAAWEQHETEWQAFFNFDKKSFLNEIMNAKKRALFPDLYAVEQASPGAENE